MTNSNSNDTQKPNSGYANANTGYDTQPWGSDTAWGAGDTALKTDWITDPYRENPYEVNPFDNAYSESLTNPNPSTGYDSPGCAEKKRGYDLELD